MPSSAPAYTIGGLTRPALNFDATGHIVLEGPVADFAALYGLKALYLGLPPGVPFPPVPAVQSTPVDSNAAANAVAEGAAVNTPVGLTVSATHSAGLALTYSLTADSSGGGFKIDSTTGAVSVADPTKIDFESSPGHAYTVTARASDGIISTSQTFTIGVTDVAPSTPVDSNGATNTVAEGAAVNTTVGITAAATDVNGGTITWSLSADSSGGGFKINPTTGVISVNDPTKIDYESAPGHAYTVTASASDGTLSSTQTFTIAVTDVAPSTPVDSNAAANTVAEGAANGSTVGLTASSVDPNGPATVYTLTDDAGGRFAINSATGVVTVANGAAIDYETAPGHAYGITVLATAGAQTTTQTFSIGVTDVAPSAPVDTDNAVNFVFEMAANGSAVGIAASSVDPGGSPIATYSLTDSAAGRFAIDPNTGIVTIANGAAIDYETAPGHAYGITVQATAGALSSTQDFSIGVANINEAPAGTDKTVTILEDNPYAFSVADFGFTDPSDSSAPNALLAVKITTVPGAGAGALTNNGSPVNAGDFISAADIAHGHLVFTPVLNANGSPETTFTFQVQDNGGTAHGGVDLDQSANTFTINVSVVNDPPVNSVPGTQSVNEDATLTFSAGTGNPITISDVDVGSGDETVTLTVASGNLALGSTANLTSFTNNAASIRLTGTVAHINAALDGLTYHGNLNFNGTDSLVVSTSDNGNTGAGGLQTDNDSVTINVAAVNDAPVNTVPGAQNVHEDTPLVFSGGNAISISDVDAGAGNETVTLSVGNGTLTLNGTAGLAFTTGDGTADATMTFTGTVSAINTALNGLSYQGNLNFNGSDSLSITTNDNGNTGSGGALSDSDSVGITVTAVNDAPTATNLTQSLVINEDDPATALFTTAPVVSDVDSTNVTATLTLNATAGVLNNAGAGVLSGGILTYTITGAQAAVNSALAAVTYDSAQDFNGSASVGVTVDDGQNGPQGTNPTGTVSISVHAVNDAPVNAVPGTQSVDEDTNLVFRTTNGNAITISDVDVGSGDETVTLTVASGTLALGSTANLTSFTNNAATITLTGTVAHINTALDGLTYHGNLNFNGTDSLVVSTNDNGNTGAGGAQTDTNSVTINVAAVNDAPVNTVPAAQSTNEDTALVFSGTNAISISDVDAGAATETVTLSVASGTLTLNGTAGLAFTTGDGTADATMTFTGTVSAINTALNGLSYLGNLNYNGSDSLSILTNDNGHTGSGGALSDSDTVAITLNPVNDAPTLTATANNPNYAAGVDLFSTVSASAVEPGQLLDRLVLTVTNISGTTTDSLTIDGTTVALTNGNSVSTTTPGVSASVVVAGSTATVTITSAPGLSGADMAALVDALSYTDTNVHPGDPARVVTLTSLHDTGGTSPGVDTATLNIVSTVFFNQPPAIDSDGSGTTAAKSIAENTTAVTVVHATDPDSGPSPVTYSIVGGDDAAKFSIVASGAGAGTLTFVTPPDYENPTDTATSGSNTYIVTVQASDGAATDTQTITVTVTDANDAPVITSNGGGTTASINVNENSTAVTTVTATDQDLPAQTLKYTLVGGLDQGKFTIDPSTGVLTFNTAPNFETPTDNGTNNVYDVTVRVTDDGAPAQHADQAIAVHVLDVNEPPNTNAITTSGAEDATSISISVTGTDPDTVAGDSVASFHITNVPTTAQGVLYSDAGLTTAVTEGANVAASSNQATLYFKPALNFNGSVTFNAAATDTHGLTDATPATETITVSAVNDAPVNNGVPANFVVQSGFTHIITGLQISDIDANEGGTATNITTTLTSAGGGIVTIGDGSAGGGFSGGATITTNGSGVVTLTGSIDQINVSLSGNHVVYKAADGATGSSTTTLTIATNDQGHTGSGGALIDSDVITVGVTQQVWFIDGAQIGLDANAPRGSQTNPFSTIAQFNASSGPGVNDYIYVKAGTYTGEGINLKDGQTLLGDDQALSLADPFGGPAIVIETATGARPTINVTAANATDQGIALASGNTVKGIVVTTNASGQTALDDSGASVGTLTISDSDVSGGGQAVNITHGGTLSVALGTVSSSGGAVGIGLGGALTGTFTGTTGTLSGHTTSEVSINGGSGTVSYGGTINDGTGLSASIAGRTGGTVTISGTINDGADAGGGIAVSNSAGTIDFTGTTKTLNTTTGNAVSLTNNTATIDFTNGGLNIDTTSGNGFSATGGGTVNVTGSTNTINSGQGTALNISNTTIGSNNVTFQSIASNGGSANGIILDTTGSAGGLHVVGNGNAAAHDGGTIANKSGVDGSAAQGTGIYLNSTSDVQLTDMLLQNFQNFGIRGVGVNGFTLTNSTVNTTSGSNGTNTGTPFNEGSVSFSNLTGTSSITNSTISNGIGAGAQVVNTSGTLNLTVTGSTFSNNGIQGLLLTAGQNVGDTPTINANIATSSFSGNVARDIMVTANAGGAFNVNIGHQGVVGSGGTFNSSAAASVDIAHNSTANSSFNIENATFTQVVAGVPINIFNGSASGAGTTFQGRIVGNSITGLNGGFDGIFLNNSGPGTMTALVDSNTITNVAGVGINYGGAQNSATNHANLTITNNTLTMPDPSASFGIKVSAQASSTANATVEATITGNNVIGDTASPDYRVDSRFASSTLQMPGYTGAATDLNAVTAFVAANNKTNGATTTAADVSASAGLGNVGHFTNTPGGAPTPLPSNPQPLFAAAGGVQASSPTPGETHLTQSELNSVIAAAIAQWAHAGASAAQLVALSAITFTVADLAGNIAGEQTPGHIVIDTDAGGHGWFVDATPNDNSEFTHAANAAGTDLYTDPANAAAGHLDLLTTVTHEMGHELGLPDLTSANDIHDLMYIDLADGERRLPGAADVGQANDLIHTNPVDVAQAKAIAAPTGTTLAQAAEAALPASAQAQGGAPIVVGTAGNDTLDAGSGGKILFGDAGADTFVFGSGIHPGTAAAAPSGQPLTHVADYSAAQGDSFDFSALTSAFHGLNVSDASLLRVVEDHSGSFATLQINTTPNLPSPLPGLALAPTWANVAQLDGAHGGDAVNVLVNSQAAAHLAHLHVDLLA